MGPVRSLVTAGALLAILASGGLLRAQVPSLAEQRDRLRAATEASKAAAGRSAALERAAATARDEAARARARESAAEARIEAAEADIAAAQARVGIVDRLLRAQRVKLAERQQSVIRLTAALQSLARRPPALGLVQPGSTEDMVHVRAVLGTTLPVVEARSADVRGALERARALRASAETAVRTLREGRTRLENERLALVRMEAQHRLRSRALDKSALIESDRAIALGERARDIVDRMETIEAGEEVRADLEALPGPLPRPPAAGAQTQATSARGAGGRAPYRLPVRGRLVRGLGELSDTGVRARGLTIAPAAGAEVMAPAAGRVRYARRFRDYDGVVIVDHGEGWTTLISGLSSISVRVGDRLAQGAPIGRASDGETPGDTPEVTVELRRQGLPMDLTALLD